MRLLSLLLNVVINSGIFIGSWFLWNSDSQVLAKIEEIRRTLPTWVVVVIGIAAVVRFQLELPSSWSSTLSAVSILAIPYLWYFVFPAWGALPRAPFLVIACVFAAAAIYFSIRTSLSRG